MAQSVKQNVQEWKNKLDSALHEQNCITNVLEKIESKTGVKRLHIALGLYWVVVHKRVVLNTASTSRRPHPWSRESISFNVVTFVVDCLIRLNDSTRPYSEKFGALLL